MGPKSGGTETGLGLGWRAARIAARGALVHRITVGIAAASEDCIPARLVINLTTVLAISVEKNRNLPVVYARIGRCQGRPAWRGA